MIGDMAADLAQSLRMGASFARVYISYLVWLMRERPRGGHGRTRAGDIDVFFLSYGSGLPVLLLDGGFMIAETWAGQIPALALNYRVIAIDPRGHGRTTLGDRPLTYYQLAEDAAALIEALDLGPVHLVGWSDGGCTAIALALERPELVRSMVLMGAPFNIENYTADGRERMRRFLGPFSPGLMSMRALRRLLNPEPGRGRDFLTGMRRMWTELPDYTTEQLGRIVTPTLVIGCDKDEYFSSSGDPLHVFRETEAAMPNARMAVIKGGTHGVHMENPRVVNREILDFLEAQRP